MISLELPICPTSLGNVSIGILRELFNRGVEVNVFPIGQIDVSQFLMPDDFQNWLQKAIENPLSKISRREPSIRLFQIQGSYQRVGDHSRLYCPHETSTLTETEINVLRQYDSVFVPSHYNKAIFEEHGISAEVCPNFYEKDYIFPTTVHKDKGVTTWGVFGKLEKRKNTCAIIKAWVKRFGRDKAHRLNLSVFNNFLFQNYPHEQRLDVHKAAIQQNLQMELPWNVKIFPYMGPGEFNQLVNVMDIDLSGLSGAEGMNLPFLNSRCLGKKGVSLNAHAHKDYADNNNSVLVEPNGIEDIKDGAFFMGHTFNVGTKYTFDEDEAIAAMDEALARPEPDLAGAAKLQGKFSAKNTVDKLFTF